MSDDDRDLHLRPGESEHAAPSLGHFYEEAERQLGPDAPHFEIVKRALDLWSESEKKRQPPPPGKTAL